MYVLQDPDAMWAFVFISIVARYIFESTALHNASGAYKCLKMQESPSDPLRYINMRRRLAFLGMKQCT